MKINTKLILLIIIIIFISGCNKPNHTHEYIDGECSCGLKEIKYYEVIFKDYDGTIISNKTYQSGEEIMYPNNPNREGYTFIGWDNETQIAISDLIINALYEENEQPIATAQEWLDNIKFGINYFNGINENNDNNAYFAWLKEEGFNAVEIGCRYAHLVNDIYGDINQEYFNKLKDIIDIAYKYDMYIILTLYDSYDYMWTSLEYQNLESIKKMINTSYKNLVQALNIYDDRLAISFCSEPRNYKTNSIDKESLEILNIINQEFVTMVRNTEGNNLTRKLVITTGWSKCNGIAAKNFKMVDDDYTIVRIHMYQPGDFVNSKTEDTIWIEDEYQITLQNYFQEIKENFIDLGIPVYIGEFGARPKNNDLERQKWALCYISLAKSYNIKWFIWDTENKGSGIENSFAISNKKELKWLNPKFMDYLLDIANGECVPFYNTYNKTINITEEIIIPKKILNLITNLEEDVIIEYDTNLLNYIDGKYYAKAPSTIQFKYNLNGYNYYYEYKITSDISKTDFDLKLEYYDNKLQCWVDTEGYSNVRLDYNWSSTDESILTISKYSTITIVGDGECSIISEEKSTGKIGVIDIIIENGKIVSAISKNSGNIVYSE